MLYFNEANTPRHEPFAGIEGGVVHASQMTLAFWDLADGTLLPEHAHPHEQILHVVSGALEVTVEGETRRVGAGESVVLPSNVPHGARVLEAAHVIDVFHPVRSEYGRPPGRA